MKRNDVLTWFMAIICFTSLIMISVSLFQIMTAHSTANQLLEEWEVKQTISKEDNLQMDTLVYSDGIDHRIDSVRNADAGLLGTAESKPLYERYPDRGEVIGKVVIPRLQRELPIIYGTEEEELAKGVGQYEGMALPGELGHSVLAGHRDTVFRGLGKVEVGDQIIVETSAGRFAYEVIEERIVESDDRTAIVPYEEPILTLITCYPFNYVGAAPQRFILKAKLL